MFAVYIFRSLALAVRPNSSFPMIANLSLLSSCLVTFALQLFSVEVILEVIIWSMKSLASIQLSSTHIGFWLTILLFCYQFCSLKFIIATYHIGSQSNDLKSFSAATHTSFAPL